MAAVADEQSEFAEVVFKQIEPLPKPAPGPKPEPVPVVAAKLKMVTVYESEDASLKGNEFFSDKALTARWAAKGHAAWVNVDQNVKDPDTLATPAKLKPYVDRAKGKANAEDSLARHSDLAAMVGLFGYNPPLLIEALDRAGKLGKVKLIAFDEADETLEGIQRGVVFGTVVQNPYLYGYKSVELLAALAKHNTSVIPANKFVDIPARQIRKDNVDEFWKDLKAKLKKD